LIAELTDRDAMEFTDGIVVIVVGVGVIVLNGSRWTRFPFTTSSRSQFDELRFQPLKPLLQLSFSPVIFHSSFIMLRATVSATVRRPATQRICANSLKAATVFQRFSSGYVRYIYVNHQSH
jgi:hypothetical protein